MLLFFILTCDTLVRCRVRLEWAPSRERAMELEGAADARGAVQ